MEQEESNLPKISGPANAALSVIGITRLEQLTAMTEAQLLQLHGMGPKGIRILRAALAEKGLSFRQEDS